MPDPPVKTAPVERRAGALVAEFPLNSAVVKAAVLLISPPMGPGLLASKVEVEVELRIDIISIKFFDVHKRSASSEFFFSENHSTGIAPQANRLGVGFEFFVSKGHGHPNGQGDAALGGGIQGAAPAPGGIAGFEIDHEGFAAGRAGDFCRTSGGDGDGGGHG